MTTSPEHTTTADSEGGARSRFGTRALLSCVAVAGPLWAAVSLAQAATREGFDLTRHPLSALSNGDLGWLQIANFVFAGLLTLIGSVGLRRVMRETFGGTWVPWTVALNGLGMLWAGVFVMGPGDGFPVGTPEGIPETLTAGSVGHMAAGTLAFAALIIACYALGRRYHRAGDRARAAVSFAAGTALLLGNGWAMTGGPAGSLTLAVGAVSAMLWISTVATGFLRDT